MKQQLNELSAMAMTLISDYAGKNDPATIACIASTANRIRQLKDNLDEIEHEIPRLKDTLDQYSQPQDTSRATRAVHPPNLSPRTNGHHKSTRKKIRIEIDWSRLAAAKSKGKEVISEHKASDSMTKLVARLFQEFGDQTLHKLNGVRIGHGPLVSKNPQQDYQNKSAADGKAFQSKPVLDTGFHVMTHSSTNQKVIDIQKACQALGLPTGMVVVEEVNKDDWMNDFR